MSPTSSRTWAASELLFRNDRSGAEQAAEPGSVLGEVLDGDPRWTRLDGPGRGANVPSLGRLNFQELINMATDRGITFNKTVTEAEIIEAIRDDQEGS